MTWPKWASPIMASNDAARPAPGLPLGDWQARVALDENGKARARYIAPDGTSHARLPRTVRQSVSRTQIEQLARRLKDIGAAQREARNRLTQTWRNDRDWSFADWHDRYRRHPLMRQVTARLIWEFHGPERTPVLALGTDPQLTGIDGLPIGEPGAGWRVRLWHPVNTAPQIARGWREAMLDAGIRQPLWQAWRPVYAVTEPELQTRHYSNRFAGLLLSQPIFVRVLRSRGWTLKSRMQGDDYGLYAAPPARLTLPGSGLAAEFWGQGTGLVQGGNDYGAPNYEYFVTSQIRFYRADDHGVQGAQPIPLPAVPARAFCEAMFDIELATGLSAAGFDSNWADPGPGARWPLMNIRARHGQFNDAIGQLSSGELGRMRTELLGWLIPRLAIADRLKLEGHVLRVSGKWHDYEINTGNAAVRILGANRHVCIVPGAASGAITGPPLPFAGDDVLAVILSKAHMLADEEAITDPTILSQIRRT